MLASLTSAGMHSGALVTFASLSAPAIWSGQLLAGQMHGLPPG
jgi:hypothetical protein